MNKIISLAPGRTCLFGDHQDYLGLPVIACAIDRYIKLTAVENTEEFFNINLIDTLEFRSIDINEVFEVLKPRDYFASALKVLRRYGCIPNQGYDITITGNIPINSGTSSSSALLIAWINFLIKAFGVDVEATSGVVAKMAHSAEVVEHGEPGGMMDQYSIAIGDVLFINTSEPVSFEKIGVGVGGLITGVSGVPKKTLGVLSSLKDFALEAILIVKRNFPEFDLHSCKVEEVEKYDAVLPERLKPIFEGAIKNHHYTQEALKEFEKSLIDLNKVGSLMNSHHAVLKDLLKITVPRIDDMIDAAIKAGALGAKIVGSGGGGSIVAIAKPEDEEKVIKAILDAGAVDAYAVKVDSGARIV